MSKKKCPALCGWMYAETVLSVKVCIRRMRRDIIYDAFPLNSNGLSPVCFLKIRLKYP